MDLESVTFCTSLKIDKRKGSQSRTQSFYLAFTTFQTSQQKTLTKVGELTAYSCSGLVPSLQLLIVAAINAVYADSQIELKS